jgi:glycosyltransferase involved in cell wall biosynthesis
MTPLAIAAYCKAFPTTRDPHKALFFLRDLNALAARGHHIRLGVAVSRFAGVLKTRQLDSRIQLHAARYLSASERPPFEVWGGRLAQVTSTWALRRIAGSCADHAVVAYAKFLNTASVLAYVRPGVRRVLGIGEGVDSITYRLARMSVAERRRLPGLADVVEVKNDAVVDLLVQLGWDAGLLRVVPSGVDTAFFCPGDRSGARRALGVAVDAFVVAMVGARNVNKGGDRVLDACRRLRRADLVPVMAGEGWPRGAQADFIGVGSTDAAGVRTVLQAADVFVFPSLSEGMPNAVLEALACGVPCIVSDRPFMSFLTDGSDCVKVDPASVVALAEAISAIREQGEFRAALTRASRRTAERFSLAARAAQLEALCQT